MSVTYNLYLNCTAESAKILNGTGQHIFVAKDSTVNIPYYKNVWVDIPPKSIGTSNNINWVENFKVFWSNQIVGSNVTITNTTPYDGTVGGTYSGYDNISWSTINPPTGAPILQSNQFGIRYVGKDANGDTFGLLQQQSDGTFKPICSFLLLPNQWAVITPLETTFNTVVPSGYQQGQCVLDFGNDWFKYVQSNPSATLNYDTMYSYFDTVNPTILGMFNKLLNIKHPEVLTNFRCAVACEFNNGVVGFQQLSANTNYLLDLTEQAQFRYNGSIYTYQSGDIVSNGSYIGVFAGNNLTLTLIQDLTNSIIFVKNK